MAKISLKAQLKYKSFIVKELRSLETERTSSIKVPGWEEPFLGGVSWLTFLRAFATYGLRSDFETSEQEKKELKFIPLKRRGKEKG